MSNDTPPVRLSTPPIAAVVASCTLTGSASVPAPPAVICRLPGSDSPGPGGSPAMLAVNCSSFVSLAESSPVPATFPRAPACVSTDFIDVKNVSIGPMVMPGPASASRTADAAPENSMRGRALFSAACSVDVLGGGSSVIGASQG